MITTAEIVPLLLKACPEFSQTWEEHVAYWKGEPAGNYNDASAFVDFLIEYYERGQHDVLGRAFTVIEEMILDGDEDVRGVAIVGHLESLQNRASWLPYGSEAFVQYLRPHSRAAWGQIQQWWAGGKSLMDIVRDERAEPGAAPNGGPGARPGNSGATEGPPAVS